MLFFIASALVLARAQQDCVYRIGNSELELNLYSLKGQRFFYQSNDNTEYAYSPCQNAFPCAHDGVSVNAMFDHSPDGVNECFPWAVYDSSIQPFYDGIVGSFIFNYTNGESCPDGTQINRTVEILWTCDEDRATPRMKDVFRPNECNVVFEMAWAGACFPAPPPNENCEFRSGLFGGAKLNLSTVKGKTVKLTQINQNGDAYTNEFTPCDNGITCTSAKSGNSKQVMADIRDSGNQCAKYLAIWSGDNEPFYDRTVFGQDYWDFFWMNGEECGEGNPLEVLNVRYYCNPRVVGLNMTRAYANGPCQFRIEIDSNLACANASDNFPEKTLPRLTQKMFSN